MIVTFIERTFEYEKLCFLLLIFNLQLLSHTHTSMHVFNLFMEGNGFFKPKESCFVCIYMLVYVSGRIQTYQWNVNTKL